MESSRSRIQLDHAAAKPGGTVEGSIFLDSQLESTIDKVLVKLYHTGMDSSTDSTRLNVFVPQVGGELLTRFKIDVPSWFKPGDAVVQATPYIKGRSGSVEGKRIQMWVKIIDKSESFPQTPPGAHLGAAHAPTISMQGPVMMTGSRIELDDAGAKPGGTLTGSIYLDAQLESTIDKVMVKLYHTGMDSSTDSTRLNVFVPQVGGELMTRFKIDVPSWFKPGDAVVQATPFIKGRLGSVEGKRIQMWVKVVDPTESTTQKPQGEQSQALPVTPMAPMAPYHFGQVPTSHLQQAQAFYPQQQQVYGQQKPVNTQMPAMTTGSRIELDDAGAKPGGTLTGSIYLEAQLESTIDKVMVKLYHTGMDSSTDSTRLNVFVP